MSNMYENLNQELVGELYRVKRQLQAAEDQLRALQGNTEGIHFQIQLYNLQMQLQIAKEQIESRDREIFSLKADISDISQENNVLKYQNQQISNYFQNYIKRIAELEEYQQEKSNITISEQPQPQTQPQPQPMNSNTNQEESTTIAMKLKLCKDPPPAEASSNIKAIQPKSEVQDQKSLKIFVGQLNSETNENSLKEYFSKFGTVIDVYFPVNNSKQKHGYAYVTFSQFHDKHPLDIRTHLINGCRAYVSLSGYKNNEGQPSKTLMASGVIQNVTDKDLIKHFSKFGKVVDIQRKKESNKKYCRWAFITYNNFESVDRALAAENHILNGHQLDCRRAHDFNLEGKKSKNQRVETLPGKSLELETVKPSNVVDVTKLLISNLKITTTATKLKKYFSQFGTVHDAYIPTVYGTNSSKGFGYVVMPTKDVTFSHDNHLIDDNQVKISEDDPRHLPFKTTTLLVSAGPQIMAKISEKDLQKFFSRFGKIVSVRKPSDPSTRSPSHYAFVEYTSESPVEKAVEHPAYVINGNIVCVTKSRYDPHKK